MSTVIQRNKHQLCQIQGLLGSSQVHGRTMVPRNLLLLVVLLAALVVVLNLLLGRRVRDSPQHSPALISGVSLPLQKKNNVATVSVAPALVPSVVLNVTETAPPYGKQANTVSNDERVELNEFMDLKFCSEKLQFALDQPVLSPEEVTWCTRALDPNGGAVQVGVSWGNLKTRTDRDKFDRLNCNIVSKGENPSCSDAWGDQHVKNWRKNLVQEFSCNGNLSTTKCYRNEINDQYCTMTNARIDFSKYQPTSGSGGVPSKLFEKTFLSLPCEEDHSIDGFKFSHLFTAKGGARSCDLTVSGTTLLYSHDNVRNLCHTWNDVMNVWLMLWLENAAEDAKSINFLTVDAMKLYNNYNDLVNSFFTPYQMHFKNILRGVDFGRKTVCFDKLILQPLPSRGFVWENWHQDLPCSFVGPSSLFQRWNVQMRKAFNSLSPSRVSTTSRVTVLLIVRRETKNDWGSYRTSRLLLNEREIIDSLKRLSRDGQQYELLVRDMSTIPDYGDQVRLMMNVSIVVAMHGAGLTQSMYLSVGTKNCCGVIEMFPKGEFTPVRGYANMMRKMGLHYDRIDIDSEHSRSEGAIVPVNELQQKMNEMLIKVTQQPSCLLPIVAKDLYLH